jgi:hypothetical protein
MYTVPLNYEEETKDIENLGTEAERIHEKEESGEQKEIEMEVNGDDLD